MNTIEAILELSGPFTSDKARELHRHWLEGIGPDKQRVRLADLRASEHKNFNQSELKYSPA